MDDEEEKTEKKSFNRKPISYSTEFRGGELKCYIHTDRQTYRPSDEVGCRGAFAPKNARLFEKASKKIISCVRGGQAATSCPQFKKKMLFLNKKKMENVLKRKNIYLKGFSVIFDLALEC